MGWIIVRRISEPSTASKTTQSCTQRGISYSSFVWTFAGAPWERLVFQSGHFLRGELLNFGSVVITSKSMRHPKLQLQPLIISIKMFNIRSCYRTKGRTSFQTPYIFLHECSYEMLPYIRPFHRKVTRFINATSWGILYILSLKPTWNLNNSGYNPNISHL